MMPLMTIIVPAFKSALLAETLRSIERQTCKDFHLIIADDASPHDIWAIARECKIAEFHRFEENLGGKDLVRHWNRCVKLAKTEFIWLFSDDDIMGESCVEAFHQCRAAHPRHDVYRFNTIREDLASGSLTVNPEHPEIEESRDFLLAKIQARRESYMPEYIFSREVFDRNGESFVTFPLAWNSDDASWALFATSRGIRTIPGPKVTWRFGGGNISGDTGNSLAKARADQTFARWASDVFGLPESELERMRVRRIMDHYRVPFFACVAPSWLRLSGWTSGRVAVALAASVLRRWARSIRRTWRGEQAQASSWQKL